MTMGVFCDMVVRGIINEFHATSNYKVLCLTFVSN